MLIQYIGCLNPSTSIRECLLGAGGFAPWVPEDSTVEYVPDLASGVDLSECVDSLTLERTLRTTRMRGAGIGVSVAVGEISVAVGDVFLFFRVARVVFAAGVAVATVVAMVGPEVCDRVYGREMCTCK